MITIQLPPRKNLWLALSIFIFFTAYHSYMGYRTAVLNPISEATDQTNIGLMELRLANDTLYQRDYLFQDTTLFRFYTPAFIALTTRLRQLTGSFAEGLALLQPVVIFTYLIGMYLLIYQVAPMSLVALLIAILSSFQRWSIAATFWGVTGLSLMMPRTIFLMVTPWLLLFWFAWLPQRSLWKLPLVAFGIGLAGNLHPVSGFFLMQLLMTVTILTYGFTRETIHKLVLPSLAAPIGVWPTLTNFLRNTNPNVVETAVAFPPFSLFYNILQQRLSTLFPVKPEVLLFFRHPVTANEQIIIIWIYLGLMILWFLAYILHWRGLLKMPHPHFLMAAMLTIQLPMAFLLTRFSAPTLFIFSILYAIFILSGQPDKWDRWLLILLTATICYSFVAGYLLDILWRQFELFRLTPLMGEQGRIARFVYLPLYLYMARMLAILTQQMQPSWQRTGFTITLAFMLWRSDYTIALVAAAFCATILLQLRYKPLTDKYPWINLLLEATILALSLNVLLIALGIGGGVIVPVTIVYTLLRLTTVYKAEYKRWTAVITICCLALLIINLIQGQAVSAWQSIPEQLSQHLEPKISQEQRDTKNFYDWAREQTPIDSLFYYDSLEFRLWAQRSLTHSWKDLGIAYYSQALLIPFYERYQTLQAGYEDANLLLAYAAQYDVNYIVIESHYNLAVDLPIAFQNSSYTVYEFPTGGQ